MNGYNSPTEIQLLVYVYLCVCGVGERESIPQPDVLVSVVSFSITPYCKQKFSGIPVRDNICTPYLYPPWWK